jgi:cytoskeletal protein CcmA (bactofilin family)
MLEIGSPALTNQHYGESNSAPPIDADAQPSPDAAFDPEVYFDRWFADVRRTESQMSGASNPEDDFYFEATRGSKGELTFEGVLHFEGYTLGNIRSPKGTLVLSKEGRVDADIDVGKAVISGTVTGNINAPEGVILDSDARVAGRIHTRMLSVRVGALFEGDCLFGSETADLEESSGFVALQTR